jgi:hypothetical protein
MGLERLPPGSEQARFESNPSGSDSRHAFTGRRKLFLMAMACAALLLAAFAGWQWLEAGRATALVEVTRRIHPHASLAEVTQELGAADYTFQAPDFPPWLQASAVGNVKEGTVLVYVIKRFQPRLLIIHLLPDSGVQSVTWEQT